MFYTIASKCGHIIDHSTESVGHGKMVSPTTSFCPSCRDFQSLNEIRQERQANLESATKICTQPCGKIEVTNGLKAFRSFFRKICIALRYDIDYREQHDDLALAPRDTEGNIAMETQWMTAKPCTGADMFEWPKAATVDIDMTGLSIATGKAGTTKGKHARFNDGGHRAEGEYRRPVKFCRKKTRYEPGRYADTSGKGFFNTSDPEAEAKAMAVLAAFDQKLAEGGKEGGGVKAKASDEKVEKQQEAVEDGAVEAKADGEKVEMQKATVEDDVVKVKANGEKAESQGVTAE